MKRKSCVCNVTIVPEGASRLSFGDCPRPKKSKTSDEGKCGTPSSSWNRLPSVVLYDIFRLLSRGDRRSTSAVCKHWRRNSFHPKLWQDITFDIRQNQLDKAKFQIEMFGRTCCNARVKLDSLSEECIDEFLYLLDCFQKNNRLKTIMIEPTHCRFEGLLTGTSIVEGKKSEGDVFTRLSPCLSKLTGFSIGCIEDLSHFVESILNNLSPDIVTVLGLASIKYDPLQYRSAGLDPARVSSFVNLRVLSVDYDNVSDPFLSALSEAPRLERLVCHLHRVRPSHPGTTEDAWVRFKRAHPACGLRLNVVHAYDAITNLHETVMRRRMPLTHFRAFFCEMVNVRLINDLSCYSDSLRSLHWIDSMTSSASGGQQDDDVGFVNDPVDVNQLEGGAHNNGYAYDFLTGDPDPFVLLAWLCRSLEEFVLYGYKYWEENLVAIGRLREDTLKRFEVLEEDVVYGEIRNEFVEKSWKEVKTSDVHLVVRNPAEGDSDEFMLPIVLADLDLDQP